MSPRHLRSGQQAEALALAMLHVRQASWTLMQSAGDTLVLEVRYRHASSAS